MINDPLIEAEKFKKIGEKLMPVRDVAGESFAGGGEN